MKIEKKVLKKFESKERIDSFEKSGHTSSSPNISTLGRLTLIVTSPSGKTYTCSTQDANLKVLQFTPEEYGTYTIKVFMNANSSYGSVNFGVAWR